MDSEQLLEGAGILRTLLVLEPGMGPELAARSPNTYDDVPRLTMSRTPTLQDERALEAGARLPTQDGADAPFCRHWKCG